MSSAVEPSIVLAAYAEPVATGRRVLVIGPALSALTESLLERGARLVHVCDPDPVRLAQAAAKNRSGNVSFSALADGHFALRDGAFDVCIVEDASIAETTALMGRIRRALTPRGVALFASANTEVRVPLVPHPSATGAPPLDYYALYDAVRAEFEHVRMLGQAPFVGYVVADFAPEGTPEPSLDTAFVPGGAEEPELFIAVASQQPVELEAFAVVQLPFRSVMSGVSAPAPAQQKPSAAVQPSPDKLREIEAEREEARLLGSSLRERLRELESEQTRLTKAVAERDAKLRDLEGRQLKQRELEGRAAQQREADSLAAQGRDSKLRESEAKLRESEAKLRESEPKLRESEAKLHESEPKLRESETKLREFDTKLRDLEAKLRESETKLRELEPKLVARGSELVALRQELEQKNQQLSTQAASLDELTTRLSEGPSPEEAANAANELEALERALQERGEAIRKLERELREAERVGKELVRQLPAASQDAAPTAGVSKAGDAESLAQKLAKSQADLIATRWALEAAVRRGPAAEPPTA
jgi:peptidoglycan hydrolase CwlO-like protein